jgi:tetratricopeptide (TPR) repeat protein
MLNYKLQITNYKQILIPNYQNHKLSFKVWSSELWYCILFVICVLCIGVYTNTYALDLQQVKVYFLEGDYKSAILEGEKLLAQDAHSDELYYILGLSYMKDGNYLRASDIFEIILKEFKNTPRKDEAKLGLGDTYFLRGDFYQAQGYYKDLIDTNPGTKLKAQVYYRLSQVGFKKGDTQLGKEYLDKLKQEFPLYPESKLSQELYTLTDSSSGIYYTVQVGAFSNITNARNLTQKLIHKGYPAYVEEINIKGETSYRVRVGKSLLRQEIINLADKLSQEGYPTRIFP